MRAREFLYEDGRSKIEKLEELIAHPGTEDTVKSVAMSRLALLKANNPPAPLRTISVPVNLDAEALEHDFLPGLKLGSLYDGLCSLKPSPNRLQFLRQGQIQMMVPPPFMGKTKVEYVREINQACPGARKIDSQMVEGQGYFFTISYV